MYLGLLNFSMLAIFGIAGLVVTFEAPDIMHSGKPPQTTFLDFTAPSSFSDREVGSLIAARMGTPRHADKPYIHRGQANRLLVDFYSVDGLVRGTLLENTNRIEIETYRNSIWRFIDNAHTVTIADRSADPAVRAWSWYMEFAVWSLIAMCATGIWLGVASRWRFTWTRVALASGCVVFLAFYFLER